jgi:hypothetical protein
MPHGRSTYRVLTRCSACGISVHTQVSNRVRMGEMCYHEEQVKSGTTPKDLNDKRKMHRTR